MACEVGRSQRALLSEVRGSLRPPSYVKYRPQRIINPVMMMTQTKDCEDRYTFELMYPSRESHGKSIVEIAMGPGYIFFVRKIGTGR